MKTEPNDSINPIYSGGIIFWSADTNGLTKRELFAAMAMQSLIPMHYMEFEENAAKEAVVYADALIKELNKQEDENKDT